MFLAKPAVILPSGDPHPPRGPLGSRVSRECCICRRLFYLAGGLVIPGYVLVPLWSLLLLECGW